jgi:hypothetical protein
MTYLRQNTTATFLPQDIYNLNAAAKRIQLHGLSATDALFADLKARGIPYQINPDPDGRTRYFFFAFPKALDLARDNQDVILADCTYNTTKYSLLLLYLVGKFNYRPSKQLTACFRLEV